MQSLFAKHHNSFKTDTRKNHVQGVNSSQNIWAETADMKNVTRIRGICHQEIGRLVTSTKNTSKEVNFFEMAQKNNQFG